MTSSTVAVHQQGGALAIATDQQEFTAAQLEAFGIAEASRGEQLVFLHTVQRTGLDPAAKQIYAIGRKDKQAGRTVFTIQTGIDGYRLIARRAADRCRESITYEDTQWCGQDGIWRDAWLANEPPAAARTAVVRQGERFPAVAVYREYVQTTYNGEPNSMWRKMPANQLAKCAEALALRKAFPQELSGVYIDDEMGQADSPAPARHDRPRAQRSAFARPDDVIDGEVVDDQETGEQINDAQRAKMHATFNQLGITERDQRLKVSAVLVGRDLDSSNDLSMREASGLIEKLERLAGQPAEKRQAAIGFMLTDQKPSA